MSRESRNGSPAPQPHVRCAIYTRKSTEEGLEQEFNSLDAQRESAEAYIKSLATEGWTCLSERYDDGGFSGGNADRPALHRLMADIEAGKIDIVVCYKVDRLSRSLLDFAKMMQTFEQYNVSFVSVTQQFNTATSMGRLVLNVLLSFAQFEREIIAERIRDKIAATRRKGKWTGGHPILGYDVDPNGYKLRVNDAEAVRVRAIFDLYVQHESLLPVAKELAARNWRNKRWQTRKGHERGGKPFDRTTLHRLLTNPAYIGKVHYKDEVHNGEHAAVVSPKVFHQVQSILHRNGSLHGAPVNNRYGALLKGLLRCVACDAAMIPSHTTRKKARRYRYYVCSAAQKRGWHLCPSKSIPGYEIERFVLGQIKCIGRDPAVRDAVLARVHKLDGERTAELETEQRGLEKDLVRWHAELRKLTIQLTPGEDNTALLARLADLQERIRVLEERVTNVRDQLSAVRAQQIDADEATKVLASFDPVWDSLTLREQTRLVAMLIERVDYDGTEGKIAIIFRPTGIKTLADELGNHQEEQTK